MKLVAEVEKCKRGSSGGLYLAGSSGSEAGRMGIAKGDAEPYRKGVIRKLFIILLSAAYLGLALGGVAPVVYCTADLEACPGETTDSCGAASSKDCCSHKGEQNEESGSGCCVAIAETGHGWVLPSTVKVPDFTPFECYTLAALVFEIPVRSTERATWANSPDPPGPAGRALLIRVSRQLV